MSTEKLPETYHGYPTGQLLELWDARAYGRLTRTPSREELMAMYDLLDEYKLAEYPDDASIARCKRLMAPFGVDPAPWADENGVTQDDLWAAHDKKYGKVFEEIWDDEEEFDDSSLDDEDATKEDAGNKKA